MKLCISRSRIYQYDLRFMVFTRFLQFVLQSFKLSFHYILLSLMHLLSKYFHFTPRLYLSRPFRVSAPLTRNRVILLGQRAPAFRSLSTILSCPIIVPPCRAGHPSGSGPLSPIVAPASSRLCTIPSCTARAASCRSQQSAPILLTSAPAICR